MTTDYYRDNTVALEALKAGQFDYWLEMTAKNWANAYNIPAVTEGQLDQGTDPQRQPHRHAGFVFNLRHADVPGRARAPGPGATAGFRMDQQADYSTAPTRALAVTSRTPKWRHPPAGRRINWRSSTRSAARFAEQVFSEAFQNPVTDAAA